MLPISFIAVHGGAGVHSSKNEKKIKQSLRNACSAGLAVISGPPRAALNNESTIQTLRSLDMVEHAIMVLEDEEQMNAGYGSNLTIDGTVECDAAITSGCGDCFGSVGAVSGVRNPIRLARSVLEYSRRPDKLGRVPPLTLVSSGAKDFATGNHVETVLPEALISPHAYEVWRKWKQRLENADQERLAIGGEETLADMQDTVGAVAFHEQDGLASGVSSGGLLLKYPGRVGEAAVFGAGCWANQTQRSSRIMGMACSISGTGEYIVRANFARKLGDALNQFSDKESDKPPPDPHDVLNRALIEFWESCRERREEVPSVGIILFTAEDNAVRLWCAFTTASMAIGYASSEKPKPKAVILRHPNPHAHGSGKAQIYVTSLSI